MDMLDCPMIDSFLSAYARMGDHPMKLRILRALLRLRGSKPIRTRLPFGTFDIDLDDYIQNHMFFNGAYEPKTLALIQSLLKPGDCFIDVGANIGQFAMAAGSLLRDTGLVVAIEPNPSICAELLRNRVLNSLERTVIVVPVAIADRHELATFGIPTVDNRGSSREVTAAFLDKVHLFTTTLREICIKLNMLRIDVLKIDVEGGELAVLRSLLDGGKNLRPRHIVCEYLVDTFAYSDDRGNLISCLLDEGYAIKSIEGKPFKEHESLIECNIWASMARIG
jgi:FkbM family methyltransferase